MNAWKQRILATGCVLCSFSLLFNTPTFSAILTFNGTGNWSDGTKWSGGSPPSPTDDAVISGTCTYDVSSSTCESLKVNSSSSIDLGNNSLSIIDNLSGTGSITISSGTICIGGDNNFAGSFTIGATSTICYNSNTNQIVEGGIAYANLSLSGTGEKIMSSDVEVDGLLDFGSSTLAIQNNTLTINGSISSTTGGIIGTQSNKTGNLIIGGTGAALSLPFSTFTEPNHDLVDNRTLENLTVTRPNGVSLTTDLYIDQTGTLTLNGGSLAINGNTLTIYGTLSLTNGIIGSSTSDLVLAGTTTSAQSILMDQASASNSTLNNLSINRPSTVFTLSDDMSIDNTLTITTGTLATANKLTLLSTSSGTANLAKITGSITGNVTVQRFVPSSGRRWRFLSSPVSSATFEDWRNEIYITGAGVGNTLGTLNSDGFDATSNNAPSAYWYDETVITGNLNSGWVAVNSTTSSLTNVPIEVGKGYRLFIRGPRGNTGELDGTVSTQGVVTLDLTGAVNTGNISIPVSYTSSGIDADDGWNMEGNPYPCAYDWNKHYDSGTNYSNLDPVIYMFDGSSNSYKSYNASSNAGTLTNGIIPSGCAFFVKATAASPSLTFIEDNKSSTIVTGYYKTGNEDLHISLALDSVTSDEMVIAYRDNAKDTFDKMDILELANPDVNIASICSDNVKLTVDARLPKTGTSEHIPLYVQGAKSAAYQLSISGAEAVYPTMYVWLIDKFTNTKTDLKTTTHLTVNIDPANPLTFGADRFYLLTEDNPSAGIDEITLNKKKYALYYDVATGQLFIHHYVNDPIKDVQVYDATGRTVLQLTLPPQNDSVIMNAIGLLPPGLYFVTINRSQTLRFVK